MPWQRHARANQSPIKPILIALRASVGLSACPLSPSSATKAPGRILGANRIPHSSRLVPGAPLPAVSFFEGFRTPATLLGHDL
jgi:hypothetical protein